MTADYISSWKTGMLVDWGSWHQWLLGILLICMWENLDAIPQNCLFHGGHGLSTRVYVLNAIWINSPLLQGSAVWPTHRQTDSTTSKQQNPTENQEQGQIQTVFHCFPEYSKKIFTEFFSLFAKYELSLVFW